MDNTEKVRKIHLAQSILSEVQNTLNERAERYLEISHQEIIANHYFAYASTECLYLYRDGYFFGVVMMSHAINEGIIKFISVKNKLNRKNEDGNTKNIEEVINELKNNNLISANCAKASLEIWSSFRADIHHMNPTVSKLNFRNLAKKNLKNLSVIEKHIFGFDIKNGKLYPHQPKYWDINEDGTTNAYLRLE